MADIVLKSFTNTNSPNSLYKAHKGYLQKKQLKHRDLKSSVQNHFTSNYRSGKQMQAESGVLTTSPYCQVRIWFTSMLMILH